MSHCCIPRFITVFLGDFYVRPGQVFRKPCLVALRILAVVGLKSDACKYWDSSGFEVCARMLFTILSDCYVPRGTSHIPAFLFLVPFIISSPLFWMDIYFLSIVMVHPSSHKNPNDIHGDVYIFGKMWICLACLLRRGSCSFSICVDSLVLPYGSLDFILFSIFTGSIVGAACLARCIFAPESVISSMFVIFGLGGVSI